MWTKALAGGAFGLIPVSERGCHAPLRQFVSPAYEVGPLALAGDPAADLVDVALERRILDERRHAQDVAGGLAADRDLFLLREAAQEARRARRPRG